MQYQTVAIPTNQSFLSQWHAWILSKVSRKFKRDKERIPDAAQDVRVRLLTKDFIGRWFFKHLRHEIVDRSQAQRMLGGASIVFIGSLLPVNVGPTLCQNKHCMKAKTCVRSCPDSLWRVSDILDFAKFDYARYYYSIQGHTISSDDVLRLLGYPAGSYGILESMYRQGRLKPAELTEHECIKVVEDPKPHGPVCSYVDAAGNACPRRHFSRGYCASHYNNHVIVACPACEHGLKLLKDRGISLALDRSKPGGWNHPSIRDKVARLRWNDRQLKPMLRGWKKTNMLRSTGDAAFTPLHIMRPPGPNGVAPGIDAGLLKYAELIIDHEVVNSFKRISRGDDMPTMVFNNGLSPEIGDSETVAWESEDVDDPTGRQRVFRDPGSQNQFSQVEIRKDLAAVMASAGLTPDEEAVIRSLDLGEMSAKDYAGISGKPLQKVNRLRASAMAKLRAHRDEITRRLALVDVDQAMRDVCDKHGCTPEQIIGDETFGPCVAARTDLVCFMYDAGMEADEISLKLGVSLERVNAAINRRVIRDIRQGGGSST